MIDFASLIPQLEAPRPIYLDETPLVAVLMEQLQYLVAHGNRCEPDCPECRRLAQVTQELLQPFGEKASGQTRAA